MEKSMDRMMEELMDQPGVYGCVFSDHQGLCLGAKGRASTNSSGIISAIADQAAKLGPNNKSPVIYLENDNRSVIIKREGIITAGIYKTQNN